MCRIDVKGGEIPTKQILICIYLLRKKLERIVGNVHYCHYTDAFFCELHILKLSDFVQLKCIIMYEANTKLLPNNLQLLLIFSYSTHES